MSETIKNSKAELPSRKHYEVIHYQNPDVDIVINHDSSLAKEYGHKLAELFKHGYPPEDWESGPWPGSAHGIVDDKEFFSKRKLSGDTYEEKKDDTLAAKDIELRFVELQLRRIRAINSVLAEIALVPQIKAILESDEALQIAAEFGFSSFQFIEPVLGLVNRKTGSKNMVYENIPNASRLYSPPNIHGLTEKQKRPPIDHPSRKLADKFYNFFERHGFIPSDLAWRQFLTDDSNNLYLIDAEAYRRSKDPKKAEEAMELSPARKQKAARQIGRTVNRLFKELGGTDFRKFELTGLGTLILDKDWDDGAKILTFKDENGHQIIIRQGDNLEIDYDEPDNRYGHYYSELFKKGFKEALTRRISISAGKQGLRRAPYTITAGINTYERHKANADPTVGDINSALQALKRINTVVGRIK